MLRQVLPFELRYRFTSPIAYLMLAMLAFQGAWFTIGLHEYYENKSAFLNSAGSAYLCLSAGGMLFIIVIALITASTLYRDIEQRSSGFVYTYPLREKSFFLSHFITAWVINILMMFGYSVGLVLVKYVGAVPDNQIGPVPWAQIAHALVFFAVPNLFTYNALAFFALVLTRRMTAVYATITTVVLIFVIGEGMSENTPNIDLISIIDPFGFVYAKHQVDLMSVADKNSAFLPLNGVYWANRGIWMTISLVLSGIAFARFNFKRFFEDPGAKKKTVQSSEGLLADNLSHRIEIPKVNFAHGAWSSLAKICRLAWMEFRNVTRPPVFKLIMGVLVALILGQNFVWNSTYYIGHQYPMTSGMTLCRLVNGFIFIIVLMILAIELFFKDRKADVWQITGTTSAKVWELQLPKLFAMFGVAFVFASTIFLGGVFSQLIQGFTDIDWLLYVTDVFGYMWGWVNYVFYICLAFVLASLTGHRFLAHCLAIGYYVFLLISIELGLIEDIRISYGTVPGVEDFSEVNRYGIFSVAGFWFALLWFCLSTFFVFVGLHFWRRGVAQSFVGRLLGRGGEIPLSVKLAALVPLAGFIAVQAVVEREVYEKRNFIPTEQEEAEAADYEKAYADLLSEYDVRPAVASLRVDLFPSERRALATASLELRNAGEAAVDHLYFNLDTFSEITDLRIPGRVVELIERERVLGMMIYAVAPAISAGSAVEAEIALRRQYDGFPQRGEDPQGDLAFNGLFNTEIIPVIGYDDDKALDANRVRQVHDLPPLESRMDTVETGDASVSFLTDLTLAGQALDLVVATEADQVPIGPGELLERSLEDGRETAVFRLSGEGALQVFVGSGRYAEREVEIEGVHVIYQFHPTHTYNLEHFDHAIGEGLRFIRENLGAYPYENLRVVEIPFYQDASYASSHLIALSEKEGWYADHSVGEVQSVVQFTFGRELIRHWLDRQGHIADLQGAGMLWSALPSALALQIVESRHDAESLDALLGKIRAKYDRDRHNDPNTEPPLIQADDIDYLEDKKGTLALYRLSKAIGFEAMNESARVWLESRRGSPLIFADLYADLIKAHSLEAPILRLFETVEVNPEL